jgi:hypothetical protein
MKPIKINCLLLFSILILTNQFAISQPFSFDKNINPLELVMADFKVKDSALNGKAFVGTVNQKTDTSYYFVKGFSIYQPIVFKLSTADDKNKIKVFLAKENWKKADRNGLTDKNGEWKITFKTEGSFGIMVVVPKKNIEYTITVWVQKEPKKIKLPSPFKTKATKK